MNSKFLCSLVLFFVPSLIASEKEKNILDQKVNAIIRVVHKSGTDGKIDRCVVIGNCDQLNMFDLSEKNDLLLKNKSEFDVDRVVREKNGFLQITGSSVMLSGTSTRDFNIATSIENKDGGILQQRIKQYYDLYKKSQSYLMEDKDFFFVHLEGANPRNKKIISLKFTEDQVKQIIEEPSAMRSIFKILGVAGLAAFLVYYFNLHSKCMTLLQRS